MDKGINKFIVLGIFVIALIFRFWNLEKFPISLSMDETAIGYNAYSILNTGRDEHGQLFPLAFKSVGDYKPPVNVYLTAISIFAFGFNDYAIRFPTALIGSLTVVCFIFLLRKLNLSNAASYFGGFWLAVLPWHIHFSRSSFEAITALFFLILGVTLFLTWVSNKKNNYLPILTAVSLSLSVWAYHAERFFVPIIVLFLFIYFKQKQKIGLFIITTLIFAIPFLQLTFFTPAIKERAAVTSILREQSLNLELHRGIYDNLSEKIFNNDTYLIYRHWLGKYLNYYDLRFIFWKGMQFTPPGYPDLGLLYVIDLPFFLLGIYSLVKSKDKRLQAISLFWFFAGPLPASFTMNEQHPLRALTWLPFFGIVLASGFGYFWENYNSKFKTKIMSKLISFVYLFLLFANIVFFFDIYTKQFPRHFSEYWQNGFKELSIYACDNLDNYEEIVITDTFGSDGPLNTGLPYLYVLNYCQKDRDNYLQTGKHLSKINFRRPNLEDLNSKKKKLLIGSYWDFLDGKMEMGKIVKEIYYPNGKIGFIIIETLPK